MAPNAPPPSEPAPPAATPPDIPNLLAIYAEPLAHCQEGPETIAASLPASLRQWPTLASQYHYCFDFRQMQLTHLSESFTALTGHPTQTTDLPFLYDLIHPDDRPTVLKATQLLAHFAVQHAHLLEPLAHVFSIDYRLRRTDGSYLRILRQTSVLEKSPSHTILSVVSVCTDITHHKPGTDIHYSLNLPEFDQYLLEEPEESPVHLGKREIEVLKLLLAGKKTKEIARQLNLSTLTVDTHRKNLKKKLKLHNTTEMAHYALLHGLEPTP
jgi:DNA-binding CsgD family transcriptional regulator